MPYDIDEHSRQIELANPTLRLQREAGTWRRIQETGICTNENTSSFSKYITKHLEQSTEVLANWSQNTSLDLYDPKLLIEAHRASFDSLHPWAGQLRKTEMVFGRFTATSHLHVQMGLQVMSRLVKALPEATMYQRLHKIAAYHIAMVGLHPFLDGNGRSSRTIMALQLARIGLDPIPVFRWIEANKREYLGANNQGLEANNPKPLADLIANVYSLPPENTHHDFRLRYYPVSYEPLPFTEDSIHHECQLQSRPLAPSNSFDRSGSRYPNHQFGH